MRPVRLAQPDTGLLLEVLLLSEGFVHAKVLSNRTCQLWAVMTNQVCVHVVVICYCFSFHCPVCSKQSYHLTCVV